MNKTVKKVFLLIGILVLIFLIWMLVFNPNGIVSTVYNGIAKGINGQWKKVAGDNAKLIPESWGESDAGDKVNGKGFDMETDGN